MDKLEFFYVCNFSTVGACKNIGQTLSLSSTKDIFIGSSVHMNAIFVSKICISKDVVGE